MTFAVLESHPSRVRGNPLRVRQPERVPVFGYVVEQVPGGVAWSLSAGRFRARWGDLAVRTEDRCEGQDERLSRGLAKECKRCDDLDQSSELRRIGR